MRNRDRNQHMLPLLILAVLLCQRRIDSLGCRFGRDFRRLGIQTEFAAQFLCGTDDLR